MPNNFKAAVLGANGFIGSRLVESLVLSDLAEVRPLVRSYNGMVRAARFAIDSRVADGTSATELAEHLKGCDVLFNCVNGAGDTIIKNVEAAYRGAASAGVKRLVYLSSAVVHGNSPALGTVESSEPLSDLPWEYNTSKALAEKLLRQLAGDRAVEIVILRPMIVYGPRSPQYAAQIASELMAGNAYLLDGGAGICNTVYIDNLIHAMWLAATVPAAVDQTFFVTDGERVTWRELYQSIADAIGLDLSGVRSLDRSVLKDIPRKVEDQVWKVVMRQSGYVIKQLLPPIVKSVGMKMTPGKVGSAMRDVWEHAHEVGTQNAASEAAVLSPAQLFVAELQDCRCQLPIDKTKELLGYRPRTSFAEGAAKSGRWLQFIFSLPDQRACQTIAARNDL